MKMKHTERKPSATSRPASVTFGGNAAPAGRESSSGASHNNMDRWAHATGSRGGHMGRGGGHMGDGPPHNLDRHEQEVMCLGVFVVVEGAVL